MRKIALATLLLAAVTACSKHDPILPGVRTTIFNESDKNIINETIPDLAATPIAAADAPCPYRRDSDNAIWDGDKKIYSGFSTGNTVQNTAQPVCVGNYIIAGLTTGEIVKLNPKTRQIAWTADVYRPGNMTGGASVLDIVAPIMVDGDAVYAGGLGDAFCRINLEGGRTKWCTTIGVSSPFIIAHPAAFVMGTDGVLYAVRLNDGAIYWTYEIGKCAKLAYTDGVLRACKTKIDAATGKKL